MSTIIISLEAQHDDDKKWLRNRAQQPSYLVLELLFESFIV